MTAPLLTFYGDDFTGSTDVMEVLGKAGIDTVLFLGAPRSEQLARFPEARAVGVAGVSRMMSPGEMSALLPPIFEGIRDLGAPIFHYKLCSTFDSSPTVGSIGRALEIASAVFAPGPIPLVVGAPALGRFSVFGNLFARGGDLVHRLDRHPTMSRHPVTPMNESDLRVHLALQTSYQVGLVDVLQLRAAAPAGIPDLLSADEQPEVVLFDVVDEADLVQVGRLIEWMRARGESQSLSPIVLFGSSGIEYALTAFWEQLSDSPPQLEPSPVSSGPAPSPTLAVVGSQAPASRRQLAHALAEGFRGVEVDAAQVTSPETSTSVVAACTERAAQLLARGEDVIIHSSDPSVGAAGVDSRLLAQKLAVIAADVARRQRPGRVIVAGGDTSGVVSRELGIFALTLLTPLAPGAPLCLAHSDDPAIDGLEIMLKGGQIGSPEYIVDVARHPALAVITSRRGATP